MLVEIIMGSLHTVPLYIVAALVLLPMLGMKVHSRKVNIAVLLLSSVGILAGAFEHHHGMSLIDPCLGYALALVYVAYKIAQGGVAAAPITEK